MHPIWYLIWYGRQPLFLSLACLLLQTNLKFVWSGSSVSENENFESKYQTAVDLISHDKSNRDFRRGISILEELSLGIGRTSADALAELSALHLVGNRPGFLNLPKAAQYSQRSASLGSPKGRHFYAFFLLYGGLGGVTKNETEGWRQQELAAEQNYLPALMALGYRKLYMNDDCESALRLYRAGAILAMNSIDTVYFSDFYSLRHLSMALDSLGDDYVAKAARDVETLSYWSFQSDRKDPKAYYELGRIHQLGLHGVRRDMATAADHFERASALGHAGALGELGRMYTLGHGRELDFNLALKHLQQGAEALDSTALATIGSLLIRKVYSSDDTNMPLLYLRKAVSLNNIEGEWELAQVELREGRLDAALQHLQRAERGGHVRSTMALAQLYDNGMGGLKQSCAQAALLYKKVCEIGPWVDNPFGPREAVKEFRKGRESSALTLSLLAALEGYEVAQFNAGWMLVRGKGMEESNVMFSSNSKKNARTRYEVAAAVLESLALQQPLNPEGSVLLGDIYLGGYQVPHNLNKSALYYERAAEAGSTLGMERLALLLINGRGVPQRDHDRAVQLMMHALSHISSGQAKVGGLQALLKQLVLSYRIVFLRLCGFIRTKLSLDFVHSAAMRIRHRVRVFNSNTRFKPADVPNTVSEGEDRGVGTEDIDGFVKNVISFPTIRYSSEGGDKANSGNDWEVEGEGEGEGGRAQSSGTGGRVNVGGVVGDPGAGSSSGESSGQSGAVKGSESMRGEEEKGRWMRRGKGKVGVGRALAAVTVLEGPDKGAESESESEERREDDPPDSGRPKRIGLKAGHGLTSRPTPTPIPIPLTAATAVTGGHGAGSLTGQGPGTGSGIEVGSRAGPGTGRRVAPMSGELERALHSTSEPLPRFEIDTNQSSKQGLKRPSRALTPSSWSFLGDFPFLLETVRAPVATMSASLYSYWYPRASSPKSTPGQMRNETALG